MKAFHAAVLVALTSLGLSTASHAQQNTSMKEVVVTATRTPTEARAVLADVSVITSAEIARGGQSSLVEILRLQPGIEITTNGGAGSSTNLFIRGANSNQTMVIIDGMRISSGTLGTTALQHISPSQIDRIEILRGPASSLYGADAIGGVVQIFTKRGGEGLTPSFEVGYGTENTAAAQAGLRGGVKNNLGDLRFSMNASTSDTDGINAIRNPKSTSFNADRDGYRNSSYTGQLSQSFGKDHEVGIGVFNSIGKGHGDQGPTFDDRSRQELDATRVFSRNKFTDLWTSNLQFSKTTDDLFSVDKTTPNGGRIRTDQDQFSWLNDFATSVGLFNVGIEKTTQKVSGDSVNGYLVNKRTINSLLGGYQGHLGAHSMQLNLRRDNNSQFGKRNTGVLAYGYEITPAWQATASVGSAFRAPTFTNLYKPSGTSQGNPNLKPEESNNREVALRYSSSQHAGSVTYYNNRVKNLIQLTGALFLPVNVSEARLSGTTFAYQGVTGNYGFKASLDLEDPHDAVTGNMLNRRAKRHASFGVTRAVGAWNLGSELFVSGTRWDDAANTNRLGGYSIFNLSAEHTLAKDWTFLARLNNVFDKQYETARDFNSPQRSVFFALRYGPK